MGEILILSAGRRVSLVRSFQTAALAHGLTVTTADMNPAMSSACNIADKQLKLPHVQSDIYAEQLIAYCSQNDVRLVIPTIDTELAVLASLRAELALCGCAAIVCNSDLISICRDKRKTAAFFDGFGIRSPLLYTSENIQFPLFIKPYDGSLSSGAMVIHSIDEITPKILANSKNIYCEYLDHSRFAEYTCDAYFNAAGDIKCVVPRLRLEVRGGEVSKGKTERNNIVAFLFKKLSHLQGARGCLTIQIMRNIETGDLYLVEINPRFGGGYPLTAQAGAVYHSWLIEEYVKGETIARYDGWQDGLNMLRYDAEVFIAT